MIRRALVAEIGAGEAQSANDNMTAFDNDVSQVPEIGAGKARSVSDSMAAFDKDMAQVFEPTDRKPVKRGATFLPAPIDWSSTIARCRRR